MYFLMHVKLLKKTPIWIIRNFDNFIGKKSLIEREIFDLLYIMNRFPIIRDTVTVKRKRFSECSFLQTLKKEVIQFDDIYVFV